MAPLEPIEKPKSSCGAPMLLVFVIIVGLAMVMCAA